MGEGPQDQQGEAQVIAPSAEASPRTLWVGASRVVSHLSPFARSLLAALRAVRYVPVESVDGAALYELLCAGFASVNDRTVRVTQAAVESPIVANIELVLS